MAAIAGEMMRIVGRALALAFLGTTATLLIAAQGPVPAPVPAPAPSATHLSLAALGQLEAGLWQLDSKGRPPKQICVADGSELIQIAHDQPGCSRFVITNDPKSATVHYSCQGNGWGRTTVRVDNPRLAHVQTQGIAHNAPFDFDGDAHRIGACNAVAAGPR